MLYLVNIFWGKKCLIETNEVIWKDVSLKVFKFKDELNFINNFKYNIFNTLNILIKCNDLHCFQTAKNKIFNLLGGFSDPKSFV